MIRSKFIENPTLSFCKLTKYYNDNNPEDKVSREFITKYIKKEFSHRKFYLKNKIILSDEHIQEVCIFLKKILNILNEKYEIVFTDESKFSTCHKKNVWIIKNITKFLGIPQEDFSVNINYNFILSVVKNKIV